MSKPRWILVVASVVLLMLVSSFFLMPREGENGEEPIPPPQRLFPFYLPWDDSEETIVSLSKWLDKPAGNLGHVYAGEDGHLYVGGKRIRFLGINICAGAAFPTKEDAGKIAARLAKFGVNIVRFHHMDAAWETFNIFNRTHGDTRHLNQEALDRLDHLIAKLKENGVYVDLNLLVSRRFTSADGLPTEINTVDWKDQQVLGFFVEEILELEKEYARQLLTHRNPYTERTYTEDPAVAFVEIVNEQGLIHGWLGGVIDGLPEVFKERLREKWNEHLTLRYGSTEGLVAAWGGEEEQPEVELLENGFFEAGLEGWVVETHDGAEATYGIVDGPEGLKALEVEVSELGTAGWHVQFNYPGLEVEAGQTYLVSFRARADREVSISISLKQAHAPWQDLSNNVGLQLTTEWEEHEVSLIASDSEENARLDVSNLGGAKATYRFSSFSMKSFKGYSLKEGENLEDSTVQIFTQGDFGSRTLAARKDWVEFLYGLEEEYFNGMYSYLKEDLGVRSLIIGTIVGCSTPNMMSKLDVIDTHAYWHHPTFPGRPWDPNNWYVVNEPMVNYPNEGTIPWLGLKRVYGKPHIVSEYNHPAPNMYDAETALTLAAYAALQDWDGIFLFDYGSRDNWDSKRVRGYFDVDQHPVKMATMIPAYMLFVNGDMNPATELVTARLDTQEEKELITSGRSRAWNMPDGGYLGIHAATPLIHRTALIVEGSPEPSQSLSPHDVSTAGPVYKADTNEVAWGVSDPNRGVLVVNSSRSIWVVGFSGGRSYDLGSVVVEPGDTLLHGWGVVTLTVMEGEAFEDWNKLLLIAAGYTTNDGMRIRQYESGEAIAVASTDLKEVERYNGGITCSNSWGVAPTLVEGVPVKVKIKTSRDIEAWILDNTGKRVGQVPISAEGDYRVLSIGPEYKTTWYEISVKD